MKSTLSIPAAVLAALMLIVLAKPASAGGAGGVRIVSILSGSWKIEVLLESAVATGAGTSNKVRWEVNEDTPYYRRVLAVLMASKAAGEPVMWWDCGFADGIHKGCDIVQGQVWP